MSKYLLILTLFIVGCKSTEVSPRESFLITTKTQRSDYVELYDVSVESFRKSAEDSFSATRNALRGVREALLRCTNGCNELNDRLNWIEFSAGSIHKSYLNISDCLQSEHNPKTDTIIYFHTKTDVREEYGWAIMCKGLIKSRIILDDANNPKIVK
jgi:hypothetical protein